MGYISPRELLGFSRSGSKGHILPHGQAKEGLCGQKVEYRMPPWIEDEICKVCLKKAGL